jgi:NADPH:quinone reductase-like Zn-dependent oxidoreductase
MMKAVLYNEYGTPDVLYLGEVPKPEPADDEVLIRVRASGINPSDSIQRAGQFKAFMGNTFPKRSGCDVSGDVVQVGATVTHVKVGDAVYGMTVDFKQVGTAAEYVAMKAAYVALKPQSLSYEQAAALPLAAETALQGLRDHGAIRARMRVCINGAAGGVGLLAVQIAKCLWRACNCHLQRPQRRVGTRVWRGCCD